MKFLVPNYSCLQNPWPGGYAPRSPFSLFSVLNWICWTPPRKKILGTPLCPSAFFLYKCNSDWPGIEPCPPQWEAAHKPPESWRGPRYGSSKEPVVGQSIMGFFFFFLKKSYPELLFWSEVFGKIIKIIIFFYFSLPLIRMFHFQRFLFPQSRLRKIPSTHILKMRILLRINQLMN